ncbi:hypothetical protein BRC86_04980 [Halobacteriales archaeon QS_3_64_16]|nr:MAG: hypothetical protein BRC86_04980 [Halobacteriales archaeon QS_3_64_16]
MESFTRMRSVAVGAVVLAAVALTALIGVEPAAAATTGATPLTIPAADVLALQLFDTVIEILDRIADLLNQINRVLSEFSQLFGEGGEG